MNKTTLYTKNSSIAYSVPPERPYAPTTFTLTIRPYFAVSPNATYSSTMPL